MNCVSFQDLAAYTSSYTDVSSYKHLILRSEYNTFQPIYHQQHYFICSFTRCICLNSIVSAIHSSA
jgi:hypothetical protein